MSARRAREHRTPRAEAARRRFLDRIRGLAAARIAVACLSALLAAGCAQFVTPRTPPPDPAGTFVPLTPPFIALGDTQEHEVTGFPMHDNDGAVDAYVEVAQRPPEQALFGRRVLEWALKSHPHSPVIHLGDLLDMSCESEMVRMRNVFGAAEQPKALLPGNHDGFFMGIFNRNVLDDLIDGEAAKWERTCRRGAGESAAELEVASGAALTKRGFVVAYLDALARGPHTRVTGLTLEAKGDASISWSNSDELGFIQAIHGRIRGGGLFGHSYLAQKLRLPAAPGATRRVVVIGLDTNQVDVAVGTLDTLRGLSPGDIGHVRADQVDAIAPWLEDARRSGDLVVFAGHHNWNRLSFGSQARLATMMAKLDHPLFYISGHTHRGYWASHTVGHRTLLELNVSSLSDWPIAYRRVSFAFDDQANRLKVTAEILPNLGTPPRSDRDLLEAWESMTCGGSGFMSAMLEGQETLVVKRQRDARGTLMEWLYEGFGEDCPSCLQSLYASGLRYQDSLLEAISTLYQDFWTELPEIRSMRYPSVCGAYSVPVCIARLRKARPTDLEETVQVFRQRAAFIDAVNQDLDRMADPRIRNYMTCRAVIGAKVDYDLTVDERRAGRSESNRRAQDFFRIEATVGMD
jgi:hypothetical protein